MFIALVALPLNHPASFDGHKAFGSVVGVHEDATAGTRPDKSGTIASRLTCDAGSHVVAKRRMLNFTFWLLETQHAEECALAIGQVHVGQTGGDWVQLIVTGHTVEHAAALGLDHRNGQVGLLVKKSACGTCSRYQFEICSPF